MLFRHWKISKIIFIIISLPRIIGQNDLRSPLNIILPPEQAEKKNQKMVQSAPDR